jgi:SAM-dependent methyltransferase
MTRSYSAACRAQVLACTRQARQEAPMAGNAPPTIFSQQRRIAARQRAMRGQVAAAAPRYLVDDMADDMIERASFLRFSFARAFVLGDWGYDLAPRLAAAGADGCHVETAGTDFDEARPFAEDAYDFIAVFGTLDTVNDLPGALIHLRKALAPGGMMIASFPGAGSLPMLRQAMLAADGERPAARIHPQVDVRAGAQLLQRAGFADPVADSHSLEVRFGSLDRLVADLRAQACSSVLADPGPPLGKAALACARQAFADAATGGKTAETFEILTLTGWKR